MTAWRRPVYKPLSEPILLSLPTHICVTPPQWVNGVVLRVTKVLLRGDWWRQICVQRLLVSNILITILIFTLVKTNRYALYWLAWCESSYGFCYIYKLNKTFKHMKYIYYEKVYSILDSWYRYSRRCIYTADINNASFHSWMILPSLNYIPIGMISTTSYVQMIPILL